MSFRVVIPARHASTRLPGKALLEIAGRPLLAHVCDRAMESGAEQIIVATDDSRIESAARDCGVRAVMTAATHVSGTDRIAEVVGRLGWPDDTLVVNLQGDEPLVPPAVIRQLAALLVNAPGAALATLSTPLRSLAEFLDPNVVKIVTDERGAALYFSRAPVPWPRDQVDGRGRPSGFAHAQRHLGLYAYRVATLRRLAALPECEAERIERLEQLRALWHGLEIRVAVAEEVPEAGVDTAEDLARVRARLEAG
ncbi:MAG: 3-deoxy-manno-octulosonate cytidylyltransferase [Gammaproteobacteria bacterium]